MYQSAVMKLVRFVGSLKLALLGMALLGVGAGLSYGNPETTSIWVLVVPMAVMAVNLLTAIIINPRIHRRPGLLVFHLGLLGIVVLAAVGRLTQFEAHVEMVEGNTFGVEDTLNVKQGPWHAGGLDQVRFVQGPYTVEYSAGLVRGLTHSYLRLPDGNGGWMEKAVGDDRPLIAEGYRFYTSFNKGFAPVLTWSPDGGEPVTGAIHMPSYPLFDFKQDNAWTPPGSDKEIKFWLRLDTGLTEQHSWVLDTRRTEGLLVVNDGARRVELEPGQAVRLSDGLLRYERLNGWMGYKIFYDPTIHWLFIVSTLAVIGLFHHFWTKFGAGILPEPARGEPKDRAADVAGTAAAPARR